MTTAVCGGAIRSFRYLLHRFQPDSSSDFRSVGIPTRDFVDYTVTGVSLLSIPGPRVAGGLLGERRRAHGLRISTASSQQTRADQAVPPTGAIGRLR